jgi:hypothetical protein
MPLKTVIGDPKAAPDAEPEAPAAKPPGKGGRKK